MRRYRLLQLDVFTDQPFGGNQLAVLPDAQGLTDAEMQAIAREMHFSETSFVLPPAGQQALARLRIFTPSVELPFAGHPTIGTTFALAAEGRIRPDDTPPITLELGVGPLEIETLFEDSSLSFAWMRQPLPTFSPWGGDTARLAAALGLAPADLAPDLPIERGSAGVPFVYVPLRSLDVLAGARPDANLREALEEEAQPNAYLFTLGGLPDGVDARARMFSPSLGIDEDAATGSAAGPLGAYLVRHGRAPQPDESGLARLRIEQGVEMGRPSRIAVTVEGDAGAVRAVRVGGEAVLVAQGELLLP